jgi:DNA-binding HxlR family transcriptional regulator
LLIVRDLLQKPQRFTDLLGSLGKITPRWLTRRLKELERVGVIQREQEEGRRGVLYSLTPAGRELLPVVDALLNWGLRHAMRPPYPDEIVNPELMMRGLTRALNIRAKNLPGPVRWSMQFPQGSFEISYDGRRWTKCEGGTVDADIIIMTTPETWARVSTSPRRERKEIAEAIHMVGKQERIEEFMTIFGLRVEQKTKKIQD